MRENDIEKSDAAVKQHLESTKREGAPALERVASAWNVVAFAFMKGVHSATAATARAVDAASESVAAMQFRRSFPHILHETDGACHVISRFSCRALHGGMAVAGTVYVTSTHLCYCNQGNNIKLVVEWREVVGMCEAVAFPTYDGRPFLVPKPVAEVKATAMQVFLSDKRLVEFVDISATVADTAADSTNTTIRHVPSASLCYAAAFDIWEIVVRDVFRPGVTYSEA